MFGRLSVIGVAAAFMLLAEVAQAQSSATPAPNPQLAYLFPDLTRDIQWKGAVVTAGIAFGVFMVVLCRDFLGVYDFGTVRKTLPLEQGQLSRSLTITSAAYAPPEPVPFNSCSAPEIIIQAGASDNIAVETSPIQGKAFGQEYTA